MSKFEAENRPYTVLRRSNTTKTNFMHFTTSVLFAYSAKQEETSAKDVYSSSLSLSFMLVIRNHATPKILNKIPTAVLKPATTLGMGERMYVWRLVVGNF